MRYYKVKTNVFIEFKELNYIGRKGGGGGGGKGASTMLKPIYISG